MFLAEVKKGTDWDYALGQCKSMLNWGLHKNFDDTVNSFKRKLFEGYGYDWEEALRRCDVIEIEG